MVRATFMKITGLESIPVSIPLIKKVKMAVASVSKRDFVIVKIHTDEGIMGVGEFMAAPYFSGETQASAKKVIDEFLGPAIVGEDPFNVEVISDKMDKILSLNYFTKAAIDMALYDIVGKALNTPVYRLLGGKYRNEIRVMWHLGAADPKVDSEEALRAVEDGFEIIKLKVGTLHPEKDLEIIRVVRDAVGYGIKLRLDANQAWTPKVAIRFIERAERYEIELVEQPVKRWDVEGMARVVRSVSVPIMVDEGLFTHREAARYILREAADILGVKVMKAGGITGARKIVAIADSFGIPIFPMGMLGETSICASATVHLGVSIRKLEYDSGIAPHYIREDIVSKPLLPRKGVINAPKDPGLGLEIHDEKLNKYRVNL